MQSGQQSPTTPNQPDKAMDPIDQLAVQLLTAGYLPMPSDINPLDGHPVWDYRSMSILFNLSPTDLADILRNNGPVFV